MRRQGDRAIQEESKYNLDQPSSTRLVFKKIIISRSPEFILVFVIPFQCSSRHRYPVSALFRVSIFRVGVNPGVILSNHFRVDVFLLVKFRNTVFRDNSVGGNSVSMHFLPS